jgi:hypothetical protein
MPEEMAVAWTRNWHRHPAVRSRARLLTAGGRYADHMGSRSKGLDHEPGTCRPSCSSGCYQAKLRTLSFTLPASFRAAR